MAAPLTADEIGTDRYNALLRREAEFWDRSARGEIDPSVATYRDAELSAITSGGLYARVFDLAAARSGRVLDLGCATGELAALFDRILNADERR